MHFVECVDLSKLQYLNTIDLSKYGFDKAYQKEIKTYINHMIKHKGEYTFKYTQKNNTRYYSTKSIQNISKIIRGFLYYDISTDIDQSNSSPCILRFLCRKYNIDHILLNDYCNNRYKYIEKHKDIKLKIIKIMYSNKNSSKNKDIKNLENEIHTIQKELIEIDEMKEIYKNNIDKNDSNYEGKALNNIIFYYENLIMQQMKKFINFNDLEIYGLMFDGFLIKGNHYENKKLLLDCESFINTRFTGLDMKLTYKEHDTTLKMPNDFKPIDINDLYEKQKETIEKIISKVDMPPCYIYQKEEDMNILNYTELKEYAKCKFKKVRNEEGKLKAFIDVWSEDENLRSYEKVIFDPKNENKNYLNLFDGFNCKLLDNYNEDNIFFRLCRHVINDDKIYNYFVDWMAHIIQKPYKKTNNCIVFFSETKGVGKDSIIEALKRLFKKYYAVISGIEDIEKTFNVHLSNKLLITAEEITSKARNFNDKLKNIITRTTYNVEKKGIDAIKLNDYSNYIFTTNNENCFKVEKGDRRLCFINCIEEELKNTNIDRYEYYNFINKQENIDEIFTILKNREIKYNIGIDPPPMTKYKQDLLNENKEAYIQFLYKLDALEFVGNEYTINELHDKCIKYAKEHYLSSSFTLQKFSKIIKSIFEEFYKRTTKNRLYIFNDINKFNKALFNYDQEYYLYVKQIDKFEMVEDDEEETAINPLDVL